MAADGAAKPTAGRPRADSKVNADVAAYLSSFEPSSTRAAQDAATGTAQSSAQQISTRFTSEAPTSGPPPQSEPAWARALRLLAAVPTGSARGSQTQDGTRHAGSSAAPVDAKQAVRMNRYAELLKEAETMAHTEPGASVAPLRFPASKLQTSASRPLAPPPPATGLGLQSNVSHEKKKRPVDDPFVQAKGRGNLVRAIPEPNDDEFREDGELRKEDLKWSEHEFNDGDKENKRVLRRFQKEFKKMAAETPDGLRNPRLLTAALDFALACVKCYELDKADAVYRRIIGECRRRGMPWDVKCIQDMATLRCKQHRQADAAELLEELANKAPPHPATFINLGTVYNQLRQYERAESWFRQAVNLKGGTPGREDLWNIGICKKHMKEYDEALPMLQQALAEFQEHEPDHPVTIAKLHSTVAGCMHEMGRNTEAATHYKQAHELYVATVGVRSPLFCSAAEGLAKVLKDEQHYTESFEALLEAFEVHATCDAVHPTPLFEGLELALSLHDRAPEVQLARLAPWIKAALENLEKRGLAGDGNAGLVMSRGGKVLMKSDGGLDMEQQATKLLDRGRELIRLSHEAGEADLSHEVLEAEMLLKTLQKARNNDASWAQSSVSPVQQNVVPQQHVSCA